MAIRDRFRRALRKSGASDTVSPTELSTAGSTALTTTTTTTTTTSQCSSSHDGPQLEKTTSRLARVLTFSSSSASSPEKEREREEKRDRKAAQSRRRTHPRDRPLTTQNIRHQEMLSHFRMTFGASDPTQIETMSFVGVSPCCTRRGSLDLDPSSRGSTTSFSNTSSSDSSRGE
ncbi:hypothetical protein ISF_08631 [Cordyceps fumosorosea ARSEF 2679]|uniref:Uncharacterized protein n=1 Tax=Cordyceps fumosorosea (strain ARSEF 2679) TaxID=1081104 RepID=A0A167LYN5_CORFA|nr:hypothetical protein ISF_08631 [Cordyceps fumosorosea ARSEF 2679]OAA53692.1 hypothetical protein ISF_08631 [Cordyceps fumosorosea ARSEF 2679]